MKVKVNRLQEIDFGENRERQKDTKEWTCVWIITKLNRCQHSNAKIRMHSIETEATQDHRIEDRKRRIYINSNSSRR